VSIKFKLALATDALLLLALLLFGTIAYNAQKALLLRQAAESRESTVQSLANVTEESVSAEDDAALMTYTADLKRIIKELDSAYVSDGKYILAHTDRSLAPRQLPLSSQGIQVRTHSSRLLVREKLRPEAAGGISYSRKRVEVRGRHYDVVVGYSDAAVAGNVRRALDHTATALTKAGALVLLAGTLLAFWIAGRMTRPIRALLEAFSATGEGDLSRAMADTGRRDEVGALNREFNRMVSRLRELDELKKDFVSSVTHELKSPLGAVESYLELMEYEVAQAAEVPASWPARLPKFLENISFVKQNTGRLLGFITSLLDAAKIEKGKFEVSRKPSDIEPLIASVVRLFSEKARGAGVELKTEIQPRLPRALLDQDRMLQVLTNLLSNALKFTPRGGAITVAASLVREGNGASREARPVDVTGRRALRVVVEDTGPGIPREDLGKLFQKFYQAPGSRAGTIGPKGTGLGLYIVRSIVEAHGGKAFAESCGKGSRFGFELPV